MNNNSDIFNLIDLYLKSETDSNKANLNITKSLEDVNFRINMDTENNDKTFYHLPINVINEYIFDILKMYKNNELIIDEKYELDSKNKTCYYYVKFQNGRIVTFNDFSIIEINNIRNILYNIEMHKEEIRVNLDNDEVKMNYKPHLLETGFSSYKSLILIVMFLVVVLGASLLIFNLFISNINSIACLYYFCYNDIVIFMKEEISKKLDELFELLDNNEKIRIIDDLKSKITDNEIKLINYYRNNPTIQNKKKLYDNRIINEYLKCENDINYLIMEINSKFKRRKSCEGNKW